MERDVGVVNKPKEYNRKITCVGLLHRVLLLPLPLRLLFLDVSFLSLILQLLSSENSNVQEVSTEELVPAYSSSKQRQLFNSCPLQPFVVASSSTCIGICKNVSVIHDQHEWVIAIRTCWMIFYFDHFQNYVLSLLILCIDWLKCFRYW